MSYWKEIFVLTALGMTSLALIPLIENNEALKSDVVYVKEESQGFSIKTIDKEVDKDSARDEGLPKEVALKEKGAGKTETAISYAPPKEPVDDSLLKETSIDSYQPDFHTGWKDSPDKSKKATVDGRGEDSIEEGYGTLVIRNGESDRLITLASKENQLTIKSAEWIDDDRLFLIVGMAYGTVSKGGQLYEVKLDDLSARKVFPDLSENEEITSILNNGNGTFAYGVHTYTDDNFNEGYTEQKGLSPQY